jgi:hypothetical protein
VGQETEIEEIIVYGTRLSGMSWIDRMMYELMFSAGMDNSNIVIEPEEAPSEDSSDAEDEKDPCVPTAKPYTGSLDGYLEITYEDVRKTNGNYIFGLYGNEARRINEKAYEKGFRMFLGGPFGKSTLKKIEDKGRAFVVNILDNHPNGGNSPPYSFYTNVPQISKMAKIMTTNGELPHTTGDLLAHEIAHGIFGVPHSKGEYRARRMENSYRNAYCIPLRKN